jgi:DNA primase
MTLLELIARVTTLRKMASTQGGEYAGPCPWCGGTNRFRVWPHRHKPGYWCRRCLRQGDALQFLRDWQGLSYREACQRLGLLPATGSRPGAPRPLPMPRLASPPSPTWQAQACTFTEACARTLWSAAGARARAYLAARGLDPEVIREARLGYHAVEQHAPREAWGLEARAKPIWLPAGLVVPWWVEGGLWRVEIRRLGAVKTARYVTVAGSGKTLYRGDTLQPGQPALLVEGGLDALALAQEAGDLAAIVAAGGTTGGRLEPWIGRLSRASRVLVAFDADAAGDAAAAWWVRALRGTGRRWRPYWNDPNAMLQAGADLRLWVREGLALPPRWWREMATWPDERREQWAERACIMEIEGALQRADAEQQAFDLLAKA